MRLGAFIRAAAFGATGAVIGSAVIHHERARELDGSLFKAGNADHGPAADAVLAGLTELGSVYAAGAAAAVLALSGRRRAAASAMSAAGAAWVLGQGLKRVAGRARPYEEDAAGTRRIIAPPQGASWPSSHPMVLTAFTTVAARELRIGRIGRAGLLGLDAAVAASRVALGVHYPSDAASGLLFGRALGILWPRRRR